LLRKVFYVGRWNFPDGVSLSYYLLYKRRGFKMKKKGKIKNIEKTNMKKQSNMEQMDSFRKEESIIPINNS
jgi:hypothetical protein